MARRTYLAWQEHPSQLAASLERWWAGVEGRLPGALEGVGAAMVAYARSAHPWQNQTGAAEAGLSYQVSRQGDAIVIEVGHSVYYGIYLEGRWGGRWGVLPATVRMGAPLVLAAAIAAMS